mgnify:CR=1 FL=1
MLLACETRGEHSCPFVESAPWVATWWGMASLRSRAVTNVAAILVAVTLLSVALLFHGQGPAVLLRMTPRSIGESRVLTPAMLNALHPDAHHWAPTTTIPTFCRSRSTDVSCRRLVWSNSMATAWTCGCGGGGNCWKKKEWASPIASCRTHVRRKTLARPPFHGLPTRLALVRRTGLDLSSSSVPGCCHWIGPSFQSTIPASRSFFPPPNSGL